MDASRWYGSPYNDSSVPDDLAPSFDANVDWIDVRTTPDDLVDIAPNHLRLARQNANASRHKEDIDLSILNLHQIFASDIVRDRLVHDQDSPCSCVCSVDQEQVKAQ